MKIILFALLIASSFCCLETCCDDLPPRPSMSYTFYQNTGRFTGGSGEHLINTFGYSGKGEVYYNYTIITKGRNNPKLQCLKNTGPAPATVYTIIECRNWMHTEQTNRPCSFYIYPNKEEEMCGRSEIFIHGCQVCTSGDETEPPTDGCSAGCIIIDIKDRQKLRVGDTIIVKSEDPQEISI